MKVISLSETMEQKLQALRMFYTETVDMWYYLTTQWKEMENEKGQGEQTWIPNIEEVKMKNYGYFQLVSFLDMYNYNYLKPRSHWEYMLISEVCIYKNSEWFIGSLYSFEMLQGEIHCSGLVDTGTFLKGS